MKAHEEVGRLVRADPLAGGLIHVNRDAVVDVEKGGWKLGRAGRHVLAQGAVDIDFAGHRDAPGRQPRIDVAGDEPEVFFEGGPAFVGEHPVFGSAQLVLHKLEQGDFVLGQLLDQVGVSQARAELRFHFPGGRLDSRIPLGCQENIIEVELAVLHDLDAEVIKRLDRGVAGQKILRPRAEGKNLELPQAQDDPGHRQKPGDHIGHLGRPPDGIFGNKRIQTPQADVVAGVEQAAQRVPSALKKIFLGLFGSRGEHDRPVEFLGQHGRRPLGSEVPEVDGQGVDLLIPGLRQRLENVFFFLDNGLNLDDRDLPGPALPDH